MSDALDAWAAEVFDGTPADYRNAEPMLWDAVIAMWRRIGKDVIADFLWYQATGEHMDARSPHVFAYAGDKFRDEARAMFTDMGCALPALDLVMKRFEKN